MKIYLAGNGGLHTHKRIELNRMMRLRLLSYFELLIHPADKLWRRVKRLNILEVRG